MGHFVGSLHCSTLLSGEESATVSLGSAGAGFPSFSSCWKHTISDRLMGPDGTQGVSKNNVRSQVWTLFHIFSHVIS